MERIRASFSKTDITPDFPGLVGLELEQDLSCSTIYTTGAGGDVNPVNYKKEGYQFRNSWIISHLIAKRIKEALPLILTTIHIRSCARNELMLSIPIRLPDLKMIERIFRKNEQILRDKKGIGLNNIRVAQSYCQWAQDAIKEYKKGVKKHIKLKVQIYRFGRDLFITIPGEVLAEPGI